MKELSDALAKVIHIFPISSVLLFSQSDNFERLHIYWIPPSLDLDTHL